MQDICDLDIKEFVKGHLNLKGEIENNSRCEDSLHPDDLASMSTLAFNTYIWYHNSLKCLKESTDLFNRISKEKRSVFLSELKNTLLWLKNFYSSYRNEMLINKQ